MMDEDNDNERGKVNAPRLCFIKKEVSGYGFNLHSEKGVAGQYITAVDGGGAADKAGIRCGDRVVEVNGVNVENLKHADVVKHITSHPTQACLLVVDKVTDDYLISVGRSVTSDLAGHVTVKETISEEESENGDDVFDDVTVNKYDVTITEEASESGSEKGSGDDEEENPYDYVTPYTKIEGGTYSFIENDGDTHVSVENDGDNYTSVENDGDNYIYAENDGDNYIYAENDGDNYTSVENDGDNYIYAENNGDNYTSVENDSIEYCEDISKKDNLENVLDAQPDENITESFSGIESGGMDEDGEEGFALASHNSNETTSEGEKDMSTIVQKTSVISLDVSHSAPSVNIAGETGDEGGIDVTRVGDRVKQFEGISDADVSGGSGGSGFSLNTLPAETGGNKYIVNSENNTDDSENNTSVSENNIFVSENNNTSVSENNTSVSGENNTSVSENNTSVSENIYLPSFEKKIPPKVKPKRFKVKEGDWKEKKELFDKL